MVGRHEHEGAGATLAEPLLGGLPRTRHSQRSGTDLPFPATAPPPTHRARPAQPRVRSSPSRTRPGTTRWRCRRSHECGGTCAARSRGTRTRCPHPRCWQTLTACVRYRRCPGDGDTPCHTGSAAASATHTTRPLAQGTPRGELGHIRPPCPTTRTPGALASDAPRQNPWRRRQAVARTCGVAMCTRSPPTRTGQATAHAPYARQSRCAAMPQQHARVHVCVETASDGRQPTAAAAQRGALVITESGRLPVTIHQQR